MREAGKKINTLLNESIDECINSNNHKSFEQKIEIWDNNYVQIQLIYTGIKFTIHDNEIKNEIGKKYFIQTVNVFTGIFFIDFLYFKHQAENETNKEKLERLYNQEIGAIYSRFSDMFTSFDTPRGILFDENLPLDINTEVWSLNNELPKSIEHIGNRLKVLDSHKVHHISKNTTSEQAFNLGFYILNSQNLWHMPSKPIFKSNDDFKTNYFPSYKPISESCYKAAKIAFDIALEHDPQNMIAAIFKEITLLEEGLCNQDIDSACINRLKTISAQNPKDGFAKIELAYALCCAGELENAKNLIELALNDSPESAYVRFRSYKIYFDYFNYDEDKKNHLLNQAILLDPENPLFYYYRALDLFNKDKIHSALLDIDKAVEDLCYITNKELVWLRSQIYKAISTNYPETLKEGYAEQQHEKNSQIISLNNQIEVKYKTQYNLKTFKSLIISNVENNIVCVIETEGESETITQVESIIFLDFCYHYLPLINSGVDKTFSLPNKLTSGKHHFNQGNLILSGLELKELFNQVLTLPSQLLIP
jgi:hypothetical protein